MKDLTYKFNQSYAYLQKFLDNWTEKIQERCIGNEQRKASFYVWSRYTISIHTFHQICDPHYIPDIYVIARSCLEYEAALKGIIADPELAKSYLEFPNRAKAYYCKKLEELDYSDELAKLEPDLKKVFGDNWRRKASPKWSVISNLINDYLGPDERRLYAFWSHFTHGSAVALNWLQNTIPTQNQLETPVTFVYGAYCLSTSDFLDFVWGSIVTHDSDSCKNEFIYKVMAAWT